MRYKRPLQFVCNVFPFQTNELFIIISAQYIVSVGQIVWKFKNNPHCSFECCLMLFLTLNEAGSEASGGMVTSSLREVQLEQLDQMAVPAMEERTDNPDEVGMEGPSTSRNPVGKTSGHHVSIT